MRNLLIGALALLVGCQLPQKEESKLDLLVEPGGQKVLSCTLTNNSSEIYMFKGRSNRRPVPDVEYKVEGDWVVENPDWCQHRVELFQLDPGESVKFEMKVDSQRPVRLGLDAKRVVVKFSSDGSIESFSTVPARIVSRLSNKPLQRTSR